MTLTCKQQYGGSQQLFGTVEGDIGGYGPSYDDRSDASKRVREYIGDETFMLTYGDGVSTVIWMPLKFHKSHGKIATISGVNIGQRFGVLMDADGAIHEFPRKRAMTTGRL